MEHLKVAFQPICDLQKNRVIGHEALLRGDRPTDLIIDTAIKENSMIELDQFSHDLAIYEFNEYISHGLLFLNVHPDSIPHLSCGIESNTVLEITEHQPRDQEETIQAIKRMKAEGTKIAMDDFGVGFSNFINFEAIEPDYLKLDKLLIRSLQSPKVRNVIRTIITRCNEKEIPVIAEGIETADELTICKRLGVPFGQGYFLGIPFIPTATTIRPARYIHQN